MLSWFWREKYFTSALIDKSRHKKNCGNKYTTSRHITLKTRSKVKLDEIVGISLSNQAL